jgi:hypothetical protein
VSTALSEVCRRKALDTISALLSLGVTLHIDRDIALDGDRTVRGAAYTLRARPAENVTPAVRAIVAPNRELLISFLREASPLSAWLIEGPFCLAAPDYCSLCGNLDFYADRNGWFCAWCHPREIPEVVLPTRAPLAPGEKAIKPILTVGPRKREIRTASFFGEDEIAAAWPPHWSPPRPMGKAARVVAAMTAGERRGRADQYRDRIAFDDCYAEVMAGDPAAGRQAIRAAVHAGREDID